PASTWRPCWRGAARGGSASPESGNGCTRSTERSTSSRHREAGPVSPFRCHWRQTVPTRILLADDHAIVRQGLRALLEREGFAVVAESGDAQEALREARERCPDVAVLDFSM